MTLIFVNLALAIVITCIVEKENFSFADVAFVTAKPNQLCLPVTCGGFFCSLHLPSECSAPANAYSLLNGETQEICSNACKWTIEVLTTSSFENRTEGLYVMNWDGERIPFPILEGKLRIDVGIAKYADRRLSPPTDSWRIESLGSFSKYPSCGTSLLPELKQNRRCGAYRLLFDVDEVAKDPIPAMLLDLITILLVPLFLFMIHAMLQWIVNCSAFMHALHLQNYGAKSE